MNKLIGKPQRPIACETIKEITTQDGSRRIELWRATFASTGHDVVVFYVDYFNDFKLRDRWAYDDLSGALDKYYDLIESCYKYGQNLHRVSIYENTFTLSIYFTLQRVIMYS